jgi:thioredoxin-like negative regulator of GroEL
MDLTSQQIKEKINNGENFILDCHALWCGPCKVMGPQIDRASEIIKEDMPDVGVYKYNIDSDREFTASLGIRSVPTVKVYKGGKEVHSQPGLLMTEQIVILSRSKFL